MAEIDKGWQVYADTWKRRTGLQDRHIAEGYMRGQGGPEHMRPEELPRVPGATDVHVLLEGANLSVSLQPDAIDEMVAEWQREVECHDMDPRAFTRRYLYESMVLNRHRDEKESTTLLLAALWLSITGQNGEVTRPLLKRGDCGFYTEIIVEEAEKVVRVRSWIDDYR